MEAHGVLPGLSVALGVVFGARVGPGIGDGVEGLYGCGVVTVGFECCVSFFRCLSVVDGFFEPVFPFDICAFCDAAFVFFSGFWGVRSATDEDELVAEVGVLGCERES